MVSVSTLDVGLETEKAVLVSVFILVSDSVVLFLVYRRSFSLGVVNSELIG